jgi:hypothetical protein
LVHGARRSVSTGLRSGAAALASSCRRAGSQTELGPEPGFGLAWLKRVPAVAAAKLVKLGSVSEQLSRAQCEPIQFQGSRRARPVLTWLCYASGRPDLNRDSGITPSHYRC